MSEVLKEITRILDDYECECNHYYALENPRQGGALVAAAGKAAKRDAFFVFLKEATKENEWDMTQTLAYNSAKRVLGRGVSMNHVSKKFATKGRKADDKSKLLIEEMEAVEAKISKEIYHLSEALESIRLNIKKHADKIKAKEKKKKQRQRQRNRSL